MNPPSGMYGVGSSDVFAFTGCPQSKHVPVSEPNGHRTLACSHIKFWSRWDGMSHPTSPLNTECSTLSYSGVCNGSASSEIEIVAKSDALAGRLYFRGFDHHDGWRIQPGRGLRNIDHNRV